MKIRDKTKLDAEDALYALESDFANKYLSVEITKVLLSDATQLATKHALRAYDLRAWREIAYFPPSRHAAKPQRRKGMNLNA